VEIASILLAPNGKKFHSPIPLQKAMAGLKTASGLQNPEWQQNKAMAWLETARGAAKPGLTTEEVMKLTRGE
jgi:hypothetical protein